ncbi:hypothetical protein Spb1_38070 [Planctopirus ephydatiae]|uniref:Dialkylrecorsinol condensing enzyme n=1 Tax=Planctopirus ephydatiae TaxID=2528019 RepID=A0A518GTE2_9PLAN|nr:hypothetical protein [Planctopirus ephydatiae]QDV31861.1 hypothetical protein Spb1_38070 [Planctopirus ephydatiae]
MTIAYPSPNPPLQSKVCHSPPRHVLAICYSQSGDAARCAKAFLTPLKEAGAVVDEEWIKPIPAYPFPWKSVLRFFDVMPDCILGKAPSIEEPQFDPDLPYDLVILFYQVWFLAPSLPLVGFFNHPKSRVLNGRATITVVVCRNMWMVATAEVNRWLAKLKATHLDNLVVTHQGPIWATFITTPRYLLFGRRDRLWNLFPEPGVGESELGRVREFGNTLAKQLDQLVPGRTQPFFTGLDATRIEDKYILPELIGSRLFRFWASVILAMGRLGGRYLRSVAVGLFVLNLVCGIVLGIPILFVFRILAYPLLRPVLQSYKMEMRAPSEPRPVDAAKHPETIDVIG